MFLDIPFYVFFSVPSIIFLSGLLGLILNKRNLLILLMSIELMLLGVNLYFILFSIILDDIFGQMFALYILTIAASESAIGLAIFSLYFKGKQVILTESLIRSRN
jgi:NADH-quinone oxidoreductase subunit K